MKGKLKITFEGETGCGKTYAAYKLLEILEKDPLFEDVTVVDSDLHTILTGIRK